MDVSPTSIINPTEGSVDPSNLFNIPAPRQLEISGPVYLKVLARHLSNKKDRFKAGVYRVGKSELAQFIEYLSEISIALFAHRLAFEAILNDVQLNQNNFPEVLVWVFIYVKKPLNFTRVNCGLKIQKKVVPFLKLNWGF